MNWIGFTSSCALLLLSSSLVLGGQEMSLIMFNREEEPSALCNDGTTGGYYFSPSPSSDPKQKGSFVIYLPGGGQCWDEESCSGRGGDFISSSGFPPTRVVEGILDSDPRHTPLWGANKAYLGYCSSDGYMGDVEASEDTWGWHFRGISLVRALVKTLLRDHDLASASSIYLVGSSAGARGSMVHIDTLVSSFFPPTADVVGFLDSPYYLDVEPYSKNFVGFPYQEQQKYILYNTTGIIDADCAAAYPTEEWKCQFGQYRMPFVNTSYFMIASQYDSYQLSNNIQTEPEDYNNDMTAYATDFGVLDRDALQDLGDNSETVGIGLFAWACYNHAVASGISFYNSATSSGVSQKNAFEEYLMHRSLKNSLSFVLSWVDSCEEFDCNQNC